MSYYVVKRKDARGYWYGDDYGWGYRRDQAVHYYTIAGAATAAMRVGGTWERVA